MNERQQSLLVELILSITANTMAQKELASAIRNQADAIADLVEAVASEDEGESEDLGHLGTL